MTGSEIIPPLDFESAHVLFEAVLAVLGSAYLFRQALRIIGNKI